MYSRYLVVEKEGLLIAHDAKVKMLEDVVHDERQSPGIGSESEQGGPQSLTAQSQSLTGRIEATLEGAVADAGGFDFDLGDLGDFPAGDANLDVDADVDGAMDAAADGGAEAGEMDELFER